METGFDKVEKQIEQLAAKVSGLMDQQHGTSGPFAACQVREDRVCQDREAACRRFVFAAGKYREDRVCFLEEKLQEETGFVKIEKQVEQLAAKVSG